MAYFQANLGILDASDRLSENWKDTGMPLWYADTGRTEYRRRALTSISDISEKMQEKSSKPQTELNKLSAKIGMSAPKRKVARMS